MKSLSIAIPAYNEAETLAEVVGEALEAARAVAEDHEVLIVDDGSSDGTGRIADELASRYTDEVRVVHHDRNRGFSGAMLSCMQHASKDYIFLGPADGQADYGEVRRFLDQAPEKELVFSYRIGRGDPWYRKLSSSLWYSFLRVLFGVRIPEFSSTFLFRRTTLQRLPVQVRHDASNFLPVLFIMANAQDVPMAVLGTVQPERRGGVAKGSDLSNTIRTLIEDMQLFWELRVRGCR